MEPTDNIIVASETEPSKEVSELVTKIEGLAKSDNISLLKDLKGYPDFLTIPEVRSLGEDLFVKGNRVEKMKEIAEVFQLTQEFLENHAIAMIIEGNFNWSGVKSAHGLSSEFISSERFQRVLRDKIVSNLRVGDNSLYGFEKSFLEVFDMNPSSFKTEEMKAQGREILQDWIGKKGLENLSPMDDEKELRYYRNINHIYLKKVADLFGIEDFFKTKEIHDLAIKHFSFFKSYPQIQTFLDDEEMSSLREIFTISDKEFQDIVSTKAMKFAESLSDFKFETRPDLYDFSSFAEKVKFLGNFLEKYPVSPEELENISKLILSRGMEVLEKRIYLNNKGESNYSTSNDKGYYQYTKLMKLIEGSFLKPYAKLPEFKPKAQDFVNSKILSLFKGWYTDHGNKDTIQGVKIFNYIFGLEKPKIDSIVSAEMILNEKTCDVGNIEHFLKTLEELTVVDIVSKQDFVIESIMNSLNTVLDSKYQSLYDKFKQVFSKIKELTNTFDLDRDIVLGYTDQTARSLNRSDQGGNRFINGRRENYVDQHRLFGIIRENFGLSVELNKELFREELGEYLERYSKRDVWDEGDWSDNHAVFEADKLLKKYSLDRSVLKGVLINIFKDLKSNGKDKDVEALALKFGIFQEGLEGLDQEEIINRKIEKLTDLFDGDINNVIMFVENNSDIQDRLKKQEVVYPKVKSIIVELLNTNKTNLASKMVKYFIGPESLPADFLTEDEKKRAFFEKLMENYPDMAGKYLSSFESLFTIWSDIDALDKSFETIDRYPFLAEALGANEKYGIKLLLKFSKLDKLSKTNIEKLYINKNDIVDGRKDIDHNSRDFRIAMQDKLESYRRNSEILKSLKEKGVDVESWLNYEGESYFELGDSNSVVFSETISTSIERINKNMAQYTDAIKEVLDQYKSEFLAFKVPLKDVEELRENLRGLRVQLEGVKHEGDIKKIEGLKMAISNIESQIENPKTLPLWDKLLNNLSMINILEKDIFKAYNLLIESETKLKEKEDDDETPVALKRKEIIRLRNKIETAKKDIENKQTIFFSRLLKFDQDLHSNISPVIGGERTDGLVQEKGEIVNELLDHFNADNQTLINAFTKEIVGDLDGRHMKISVWNRNPDIDLYLGNYTDCCIRIDSAHMGSESTIADYLTDLGIQIVNIYDEKKNIPVATAWCWIGHEDNDEVAFVVDNIEADTAYSTKYKKQLEQALRDYISHYAWNVQIEKTVQGQSNNDLVIAKMDSQYYKVGGYNRASGYYLEGEGN